MMTPKYNELLDENELSEAEDKVYIIYKIRSKAEENGL
jgi:hypothetical protein